MKLLIEQSGFMDVEFIPDEGNSGNNSDKFTFKLRAEGQLIEVDGKEVDELSFDIIGTLELKELLSAMAVIKKTWRMI